MLFEIETQRVVHTDAIDFELEWLGEGLKSSSALKGIDYFYTHDNKITQIAKVVGMPVVAVGDELGGNDGVGLGRSVGCGVGKDVGMDVGLKVGADDG